MAIGLLRFNSMNALSLTPSQIVVSVIVVGPYGHGGYVMSLGQLSGRRGYCDPPNTAEVTSSGWCSKLAQAMLRLE